MHQLISHSQFFVTLLTNDGLRRAHRNHREIVNALTAGNVRLVLEIAQRHLQDNVRGVRRMQQGAKRRTPVDSTPAHDDE
jgi:DNA-binding GntR family transcriptional regulator